MQLLHVIPILLFLPAAWWVWSRAHRSPWKGPRPDLDHAGFDALHRYALHLRKHLQNDMANPFLSGERRERAALRHADLTSLLGAHPLTDDLRRWIRTIEEDPLLSHPLS